MRLLPLLLALAVVPALHAATEVKIVRPARGDVVRYVTLPGSLKANQQATLYAKVGGYLKSITVDKGDTVAAGQLLGELEVPDLVADFARTRAEANVAATELARLEAAATKSPELITPIALDTTRGRAEIARANQARAETLLGFAKVSAPFAGIVTARYADVGAFIPAATASSTPQGAALVTLTDFQTIRATVAMPELEAARVKVGQPVRVSVEGVTSTALEAKVSRLAYVLDEVTKTMLVEADLPNPNLALRPGMYATIKVGVEKHTDVLAIPVEALVMEKANAFAYVATDGKAKKTAIKIGFNDGARVEVVSGLDASAAVILVGKLALADGQAITATEAK
ncbi:MAG: efflux RND transporter periplasmic adaptor subunit [Opitutaceae bacterium]|nr:efflux RND transporter periplasmic adaptor subunit [Opitutaceae bacterium]